MFCCLRRGFDNLTNDLPLNPAFVAFVDQTARLSLSGEERVSGARVVDSFVQLRESGEPLRLVRRLRVRLPWTLSGQMGSGRCR